MQPDALGNRESVVAGRRAAMGFAGSLAAVMTFAFLTGLAMAGIAGLAVVASARLPGPADATGPGTGQVVVVRRQGR